MQANKNKVFESAILQILGHEMTLLSQNPNVLNHAAEFT